MKLFKKILTLSLAGVMVLGLAGCGDKKDVKDEKNKDTKVEAKLPEKISIVTAPDFPPYQYMDGDDIVGAEVDLIKKILDNLGVKYEISQMTYDGIIPSLISGKSEFGSSAFSITEDRKKNIDFSDPVFENKTSIVAKKTANLQSGKDLANKNVGFQSGTTSADYVMKDLKSQGTVGKGYESYAQAYIDLQSDKIDAIVMDNIPAEKFIKDKPELQLSKEPLYEDNYGFAVKKGTNKELMAAINKELKKLKDSKEYDKIIKPHFDKHKQ